MDANEERAAGCERIARYNERRAEEDPYNRDRWLALARSERAMAAQLRARATPSPPGGPSSAEQVCTSCGMTEAEHKERRPRHRFKREEEG